MTAIDGSITVLSESILDEARTEIEAIRSRAQAKADAIRQDAREAADRERRDVLDRAQQEARRLHGQATSTAQLKARAMELEHRERLLEKVFDSAAARLSAVPGRKDY